MTFGILAMLAILVSSYGTHDRIPYLRGARRRNPSPSASAACCASWSAR